MVHLQFHAFGVQRYLLQRCLPIDMPVPILSAVFITSWGVLLLEGQTAINAQPFMLLVPAACVALIVLAFTFLGDGLRDALDPRMRGTQ